jgi:hypothetical protein
MSHTSLPLSACHGPRLKNGACYYYASPRIMPVLGGLEVGARSPDRLTNKSPSCCPALLGEGSTSGLRITDDNNTRSYPRTTLKFPHKLDGFVTAVICCAFIS